MTTVSVIGSGNMGRAIRALVERGGNTVEQVTREPTTVSGDIVVLAVPYPALADIAARLGESLAGKVVVDITNPLDFQTFDSLVVPADTSAAQELAALLPSSAVLKAFNTNFAATLATGSIAGVVPTVLIAGDDEGAKGALAAVVTAGGLNAVDAGALKRARELEALGFLQLTLAAGGEDLLDGRVLTQRLISPDPPPTHAVRGRTHAHPLRVGTRGTSPDPRHAPRRGPCRRRDRMCGSGAGVLR